jgi:hypothetical protein
LAKKQEIENMRRAKLMEQLKHTVEKEKKYNPAWYIPPKYFKVGQKLVHNEIKYDQGVAKNLYHHLHKSRTSRNPFTSKIH